MGVKLYNIKVRQAADLMKSKAGFRSNAGSDAAAERQQAKEAEDSMLSDDEKEEKEQEEDEEKDEAYGKSVRKHRLVLGKASA